MLKEIDSSNIENEDFSIAESPSLDADETIKSNVLNIIETNDNFQKAIKKLEEENLIWYFVGPLRKDEEVKKQINLKWEREFEQSIDATRKKFEALLPGQSFLAYSTKDNGFNIRFEGERPVKISDILKASNENEVYNLSLGEDSQITACKKNGNERHYSLTGPSSCEMTINWQAKDFKGNSINCSIVVKVDSSGIKSVVNEPKFGGITSSEEVLKLVEQNKEVFINGKTLHQAFTDMGRSADNQQENTQPQSPAPNSSGYFSPGSRRSSLSTSSEFGGEDETPESGTFSDEEEHKQEGEGLEDRVAELEEENAHLRRGLAELKSHDKRMAGEGDEEVSKLMKEKQTLEERMKELKAELEKKVKELAGKDQDIEQLKQWISALEQSQKDSNAKIVELNNQLKDKESEIRSTNEANKELQRKLEQSEAKLSTLKEENIRLKNDEKEIGANLKDGYEKQLAELLSKIKKELTDVKNLLNVEQLKNQELAEELNQLQKEKEGLEREIQQPDIGKKSLADELSEVNAKVATSTQTEVEYESRGTSMQQSYMQDQGEAQNIMDWPVPISDDKPEEQKTPLEPIKANTKLSDPNVVPAEAPEKSTPSK